MPPHESLDPLRAYADVLVRVGVNLQPGQGLLLTEPFELQGVARSSAGLVDAVIDAATAVGGGPVEVIWADERRLVAAAQAWPDADFERILAANARRMHDQVMAGGALLFLQGSHPHLMDGVSPDRVARLRERCWQYYGPVAALLVRGETNWSVAPAPTREWAAVLRPAGDVGADAIEPALDRLWRIVFAACRTGGPDAVAAWRTHLGRLAGWRADLDDRAARAVRFRGPGTNLVVGLARGHCWCTAALRSRAGVPFVANLPTEEVFTAPDRGSAEGVVRVARPIAYGGAVIDGIELEFRGGEVVRARARTGHELLWRILKTDGGSARLGEVALIIDRDGPLARAGTWFHHTLLDENTLPHIALGDGYPFSVHDAREPGLNHSLVHLDLPIEAEVDIAG
ncbi:MAG: aminopeptidase [Opitutaceae bacterium]|nr:aminopeptidase [Opitutaceae bacterium]